MSVFTNRGQSFESIRAVHNSSEKPILLEDMSLIPLLFAEPSTIFDQHFGVAMDLDDLITSMAMVPNRKSRCCRPQKCLARMASRDVSKKDKDQFQVSMDVQHFTPEEITIKTIGNEVVIEGKHEEKEDDHGFVSRHFVRKYRLPEDVKPENVTSRLSSDGMLSIIAPRKQPEVNEGERLVPITTTGPFNNNITQAIKTDQQLD